MSLKYLASFVGVLAVASVSTAQAAALRVTDIITGDTATLFDNAPGDLDPTVGIMVWDINMATIGTMSSVWNPVITIAFSKPVVGVPGNLAEISVDVAALSQGAGGLQVEFSDTSFMLPSNRPYHYGLAFGADSDMVGDTVGGRAYIDYNNTLFSQATLIGAPFTFTSVTAPDSGAGTQFGTIPTDPDGLFSLTNIITFTHAGASLSEAELTTEIAPVPVPGALLLMGSALAGLRASRRRKLDPA